MMNYNNNESQQPSRYRSVVLKLRKLERKIEIIFIVQ